MEECNPWPIILWVLKGMMMMTFAAINVCVPVGLLQFIEFFFFFLGLQVEFCQLEHLVLYIYTFAFMLVVTQDLSSAYCWSIR